MNKKIKRLLIALCVLAAALIVFAVVQSRSSGADTAEEEERESLIGMEAMDMTEISITVTGGDTDTYVRESGEAEWTYAFDESIAIDSADVDEIAAGAAGVVIYQEMDNVTDLAQYGLDEDNVTVYADFTDTEGNTVSVTVGAQNASTGNVYVYINDDTATVYAVSSSVQTYLGRTLEDVIAESGAAESETESAMSDTQSAES